MKSFLTFLAAGVAVVGGGFLWMVLLAAIAKARGLGGGGAVAFAWLSYVFLIAPGVVVPLFVYVFD
jgi:hypothetical protein